MKAYWAIISVRFQMLLQYRAAAFAGFMHAARLGAHPGDGARRVLSLQQRRATDELSTGGDVCLARAGLPGHAPMEYRPRNRRADTQRQHRLRARSARSTSTILVLPHPGLRTAPTAAARRPDVCRRRALFRAARPPSMAAALCLARFHGRRAAAGLRHHQPAHHLPALDYLRGRAVVSCYRRSHRLFRHDHPAAAVPGLGADGADDPAVSRAGRLAVSPVCRQSAPRRHHRRAAASVAWTIILVALGRWMLARSVHRLVVQGG